MGHSESVSKGSSGLIHASALKTMQENIFQYEYEEWIDKSVLCLLG